MCRRPRSTSSVVLRASGLLIVAPCSDPAAFQSLEELTQLCSFAEDLETFEYACKEWLTLFANPVCPVFFRSCAEGLILSAGQARPCRSLRRRELSPRVGVTKRCLMTLQLVAFWETSYAPFRRVYAIAHTNVILNVRPMTISPVSILMTSTSERLSHQSS